MDDSETPLLHAQECTIPSYDEIASRYAGKWQEEKAKFFEKLKENFCGLVSNFRSGKQTVFVLADGPNHAAYVDAFRELFSDSGYAAGEGDWTRPSTGAPKSRDLYITLPSCFSGKGM